MEERGALDALLFDVAGRLAGSGVAVCGAVQQNLEGADIAKCHMDLHLLPSGDVRRISQSLGPLARGCRLDPAALESAVGQVEAALDSAQVLIVNKFGKQEAAGGGFRPVIASALAQGIPVLCGISGGARADFAAFADGLAQTCRPDVEDILDWVHRQISRV